jgi:hypothetical protein
MNMTTLYDEFLAAQCELDHHESDLYVKADRVSRAIIAAARADRRLATYPTLFRSEGALWFEVAFAWAPFWRRRAS